MQASPPDACVNLCDMNVCGKTYYNNHIKPVQVNISISNFLSFLE